MPSIPKTRRLVQILMRLQNGQVYNSPQLADFCGVSSRTLFRYLRELQDAGVPILYDSQRQGYWLPLKEVATPLRLSSQQVLSMLLLCEQGGSRESGNPYLDPAAQASQFILIQLSDDQRARITRLASRIDIHLQHQAEPTILKRAVFEQILECLDQQRCLRLHLRMSETENITSTLVSPYRLVFEEQSWHLIGRSTLHRAVQTFALSQVERAELTEDRYEIPPRFTIKKNAGQAGAGERQRPLPRGLVAAWPD